MLKYILSVVLLTSSLALAQTPAALDFTMDRLDGTPQELADYSGKVVLMVNTASKCGHTKQYAGLEQLHKTYKDKGLAVLGFPCNDFGNQEPGTAEEIAEFCLANFGVSFPMFDKISVKGEGQSPLYAYLTAQPTQPLPAGDVKWNFEKFLIGKDGKVVARFASGVQPDTPELVQAIETELAK